MRLSVFVVSVVGVGSTVWGGMTASSVVGTPVLPGATFVNPSAALGLPPASVAGGAVTPFSPVYLEENLVVVRPGGSLTLGLSASVPVVGGLQLGVFSNIGLIDVSADGSGVAGSPAGTFSAFPRAIVSVSADGVSFVPVSAAPVTFDRPSNGYLDVSPWTGYFPVPGTALADPFKPYSVSFEGLSGLNYSQMLPLLDGSAGGTWLDLSSTGLASVGFVRFEVPQGADYRLVLDAVTAIPEPGALLPLVGVLALLRRRR